jgi:hypothetical protein
MWRGVRWAILSFGWALACGGRYERGAPTSDAVAHAGGPTISNGGASGSASNPGGGGANVAGTGALGGAEVPAVECVRQFDDYDAYRSQVLAEFTGFPCAADEDCRAFYDQSTCDPSCVLIVSAAHRGIIDRLNTFENFNCVSGCWPESWMSCATAAPVHCVARRCQQDK